MDFPESTIGVKNPSRKECEKIIRRILITEILENGKNKHFRMATDFTKYFESLYPASDSLTKQIQRAVKSMDMPKDEDGFFIVDRTVKQVEKEKNLKAILSESGAEVTDMSEHTPILIKTEPQNRTYLIHLISEVASLDEKIAAMTECSSGVILYTTEKNKVLSILDRLLAD